MKNTTDFNFDTMVKNLIACIGSAIFICSVLLLFICSGTAQAKSSDDTPYIRVGILQSQQTVSIGANNDFVVKDIDNDKNYKFNKKETAVIKQDGRKVFVGKKGKNTTTLVVAVKNNDYVTVNGKAYRGALLIQPHSTGLTVINRLSIDEYLYGVIPNEMPATWAKEALKAQAVAARTYALYDKKDGKHAREGFDVCATTDCQVYEGISSETAATNSAVNETKGKVLTYRHEPICAAFHAASGGSTQNSEDVWGVTVPYLRGVNDSEEKSPYSNWQKDITVNDLSKKLSSAYGNIGTIKEISSKAMPGNAIKVKFTSSNKKSVEVSGTQLRDLLGLKSSNLSINVTADKKVKKGTAIKINKPDKETVNIIGSGYGHRLGLSQWGAKSLADKGKNYQQILLHYYSEVDIESLY